MKSKIKTLLVILLVMLLMPLAAQAFQLVPCGGGANPKPCQFTDLLLLLMRLINFLLAASAFVAMYYILMSAWSMVTSLGNPEKINAGKDGLINAVIGFAIILLSFAFVNLLVQGIFGIQCDWWKDPAVLWSTDKAKDSCLFMNK